MEIDWTLDGDGDWRLRIDGRYFGMVCDCENSRFLRPVAVWGSDNHHCADTVDEAKHVLVMMARAEIEEPDVRPYPEC